MVCLALQIFYLKIQSSLKAFLLSILCTLPGLQSFIVAPKIYNNHNYLPRNSYWNMTPYKYTKLSNQSKIFCYSFLTNHQSDPGFFLGGTVFKDQVFNIADHFYNFYLLRCLKSKLSDNAIFHKNYGVGNHICILRVFNALNTDWKHFFRWIHMH